MRIGVAMNVLVIASLLISVLPFGVPIYLDRLELTRTLSGQSMDERKEAMFAPWYAEVVAISRTEPANSAIDFVMMKPGARDIAVLAGAILQPRDVRFFDGWDSWRARRRAAFLHDVRAVNAAPGPPPPVARVVVAVDPDSTPQFRVVPSPR